MVHRCFEWNVGSPPARRAAENSPAIHRWAGAAVVVKSREGRQKLTQKTPATAFFRPAGTCSSTADNPSDESLGYFQTSLTGRSNLLRVP